MEFALKGLDGGTELVLKGLDEEIVFGTKLLLLKGLGWFTGFEFGTKGF